MDKAALIHDIEYMKPNNQKIADRNMITNMNSSTFNIPLHEGIHKIFIAKDLIGYNPPTNEQLYKIAKDYAKYRFELGEMRFADDV
jgi:hypothetical protein